MKDCFNFWSLIGFKILKPFLENCFNFWSLIGFTNWNNLWKMFQFWKNLKHVFKNCVYFCQIGNVFKKCFNLWTLIGFTNWHTFWKVVSTFDKLKHFLKNCFNVLKPHKLQTVETDFQKVFQFVKHLKHTTTFYIYKTLQRPKAKGQRPKAKGKIETNCLDFRKIETIGFNYPETFVRLM